MLSWLAGGSQQAELKRRLLLEDPCRWALPNAEASGLVGDVELRYIGGMDISYVKDSEVDACAGLVVYDLRMRKARTARSCVLAPATRLTRQARRSCTPTAGP